MNLDTIIALETSLMNFPACPLTVSHNMCFLNKICPHIAINFGNGEVIVEEGTYETVVTETVMNKRSNE